MNQNIKIALIGATGKAGQSILLELLKQGYQVKTLLRTPSNLVVQNSLIERVQGDVRNYHSVSELLEECQVVINAVGSRKDKSPVFSRAIRNIIKASKECEINRLIGVTGLSIKVPGDNKSFRIRLLSALMRALFKSIIKDKQLAYSLLTESDLSWILVRIPHIDLEAKRSELRVSLSDCLGAKINPNDLAKFVVNQISQDQYLGKAPFVSN